MTETFVHRGLSENRRLQLSAFLASGRTLLTVTGANMMVEIALTRADLGLLLGACERAWGDHEAAAEQARELEAAEQHA